MDADVLQGPGGQATVGDGMQHSARHTRSSSGHKCSLQGLRRGGSCAAKEFSKGRTRCCDCGLLLPTHRRWGGKSTGAC